MKEIARCVQPILTKQQTALGVVVSYCIKTSMQKFTRSAQPILPKAVAVVV
jgi:hypothetical protein